jgi:hypothetical protein
MVRSTPHAVLALRDNTLTRFTASGKTVETIASTADFKRLGTEAFGLPLLPMEDALQIRARFAALGDNSTRR